MRKIEMRSVDPERPAIVEMVEGRRYLVVVTMGEGATEDARRRALKMIKDALPDPTTALVAMPHGYALDVYEDADG